MTPYYCDTIGVWNLRSSVRYDAGVATQYKQPYSAEES